MINLKTNQFWRKLISGFMAVAFLLQSTGLAQSASNFAAVGQILPAPGQMVGLSAAIQPPVLKGVKVYADEPFRFDFIMDRGDLNGRTSEVGSRTIDKSSLDGASSDVRHQTSDDLSSEANKLIRYFLASLTVPEKDLWVNLSPYEKDRIITNEFGMTEMGRDLLSQDYLLKQLTASVIYPEGATGKKFWAEVYKKAFEKYGTTDIPVDTFNKVWIVPEKAVVYEKSQSSDVGSRMSDGTAVAYVVEAKLKVMLESDYLAQSNSSDVRHPTSDNSEMALAKDVLRDIVIPVLEHEVNSGANFVQLRQVYHSLILAAWYKRKIKDSLLSSAYVDQKKTVGVNIDDPKMSERIWAQYVEAFKKGAYNYIKEEQDQFTGETIPRKYFSGGILGDMAQALTVTADAAMLPQGITDGTMIVRANVVPPDRIGGARSDLPRMERYTKLLGQKDQERFTLLIQEKEMGKARELLYSQSKAFRPAQMEPRVAVYPGGLDVEIFLLFPNLKTVHYFNRRPFRATDNGGDVEYEESRGEDALKRMIAVYLADMKKYGFSSDEVQNKILHRQGSTFLPAQIGIEPFLRADLESMGASNIVVQDLGNKVYDIAFTDIFGDTKNIIYHEGVLSENSFDTQQLTGILGNAPADLLFLKAYTGGGLPRAFFEVVKTHGLFVADWMFKRSAIKQAMSGWQLEGLLGGEGTLWGTLGHDNGLSIFRRTDQLLADQLLDKTFKPEKPPRADRAMTEPKLSSLGPDSVGKMDRLLEESRKTPYWQLSGEEEEKIRTWMWAGQALRPGDAGIVKKLFLYIFGQYMKDAGRRIHARWYELLKEKWQLATPKQLQNLFRWFKETAVDLRNVPDRVFADFLSAYLDSYQDYPGWRDHFNYIRAPGMDDRKHMVLATQNIRQMTTMFPAEVIQRKAVLKAPIAGTDYYIGMEYGFVESTHGVYLVLAEDSKGRLPLADEVIFKVGVDSQGDIMRIVLVQGEPGKEKAINEEVPATLGMHPSIALFYAALLLAYDGKIGIINMTDFDPPQIAFNELLGIRRQYMPTMKFGRSTMNVNASYSRFGLRREAGNFGYFQDVGHLMQVTIPGRLAQNDLQSRSIMKIMSAVNDLHLVHGGTFNSKYNRAGAPDLAMGDSTARHLRATAEEIKASDTMRVMALATVWDQLGPAFEDDAKRIMLSLPDDAVFIKTKLPQDEVVANMVEMVHNALKAKEAGTVEITIFRDEGKGIFQVRNEGDLWPPLQRRARELATQKRLYRSEEGLAVSPEPRADSLRPEDVEGLDPEALLGVRYLLDDLADRGDGAGGLGLPRIYATMMASGDKVSVKSRDGWTEFRLEFELADPETMVNAIKAGLPDSAMLPDRAMTTMGRRGFIELFGKGAAAAVALNLAPEAVAQFIRPQRGEVVTMTPFKVDLLGLIRSFLGGDEVTSARSSSYDNVLAGLMDDGVARQFLDLLIRHNANPQSIAADPQTYSDLFRDGVVDSIRVADLSPDTRWWDIWDWGVTAGNNAWVGILALDQFKKTNDPRYLDLAVERAQFLVPLQDSDGGIRRGPLTELGYLYTKSTENNWSVLAFLDLYNETAKATGRPVYTFEAERIYEWLMTEMYDPENNLFRRGSNYINGVWVNDSLDHAGDQFTEAQFQAKEGRSPEKLLRALRSDGIRFEERASAIETLNGLLEDPNFSEQLSSVTAAGRSSTQKRASVRGRLRISAFVDELASAQNKTGIPDPGRNRSLLEKAYQEETPSRGFFSLDTVTWVSLPSLLKEARLGADPQERLNKIIDMIDRTIERAGVVDGNGQLAGLSFSAISAANDVVWVEGTGQFIILLAKVAKNCLEQGMNEEAQYLLAMHRQLMTTLDDYQQDRDVSPVYPYAAYPKKKDQPAQVAVGEDTGNGFLTPSGYAAVSPTAYAGFAKKGYDPLTQSTVNIVPSRSRPLPRPIPIPRPRPVPLGIVNLADRAMTAEEEARHDNIVREMLETPAFKLMKERSSQGLESVEEFVHSDSPVLKEVFAEVNRMTPVELMQNLEEIQRMPKTQDGKGKPINLYDSDPLYQVFFHPTRGAEDWEQAITGISYLTMMKTKQDIFNDWDLARSMIRAFYMLFRLFALIGLSGEIPLFPDDMAASQSNYLGYLLGPDVQRKGKEGYYIVSDHFRRFLSYTDFFIELLLGVDPRNNREQETADVLREAMRDPAKGRISAAVRNYLATIRELEERSPAWRNSFGQERSSLAEPLQQYFQNLDLLKQASDRAMNGKAVFDDPVLDLEPSDRTFLGKIEGLVIVGNNDVHYQFLYDVERSRAARMKAVDAQPPKDVFRIVREGSSAGEKPLGILEMARNGRHYTGFSGEVRFSVQNIELYDPADRRQGVFSGLLREFDEKGIHYYLHGTDVVNSDSLSDLRKETLQQVLMHGIELPAGFKAVQDGRPDADIFSFFRWYQRQSKADTRLKSLGEILEPTVIGQAIEKGGFQIERASVEWLSYEKGRRFLGLTFDAEKLGQGKIAKASAAAAGQFQPVFDYAMKGPGKMEDLWTIANVLGPNPVWQEFKKMNKGQEPVTIAIEAESPDSAGRDILEKVQGLNGDQLVALSLIIHDGSTGFSHYVMAVDNVTSIKEGPLVKGEVKLFGSEEQDFFLHLIEDGAKADIHFKFVSLGRSDDPYGLRRNGNMKPVFEFLDKTLRSRFEGWTISSLVLDPNGTVQSFMKRFSARRPSVGVFMDYRARDYEYLPLPGDNGEPDLPDSRMDFRVGKIGRLEALAQAGSSDRATGGKGGIDLAQGDKALEIQNSGAGATFQFSPGATQNIQIDGLTPVIIDIKPMTMSVAEFAGISGTS
jgi:hypothetical protein